MRIFKILALIGLLGVVSNACTDLAVTNLNDPDRQRAIQTPGDVESLISGSFNSVFWSYQGSYPNCPLSVAANAHENCLRRFTTRRGKSVSHSGIQPFATRKRANV